MKVLNLYAGIGGNRKLWKDVEVTAIENNQEIADIYKDLFSDDIVIVTDAHQYLLEYFQEFDFIWSGPPCQSHSRTNYFLKTKVLRYPDLKLYEEIIFLQTYFNKGRWVVENVIPFYLPLIHPTIVIGRHCFWSNFRIQNIFSSNKEIGKMCGKNQTAHKKPLLERNMVDPKLGLHIFNESKKGMKPLFNYDY
jgi:DNA (cytosine-5)-methyltransferase 1